jgi:outer membrane protein assembly factor BamB
MRTLICSVLIICFAFIQHAPANPAEILSKIGSQTGIIAVLNDPQASLAIGLAQQSELIVYLHLNSSDDLSAVQTVLDSLGYYGTRIYVEKDRNSTLPFAENFLDAVVSQTTPAVSQNEMLRVVRPGGKVIVGQTETIKQFPQGYEAWTHPHHSPGNTVYSNDTTIRPPYLTKFMVEPRYGPYPQAVVAAGSRIFRAFGHIDVHSPREKPLLNTLFAFNAFNGTVLWKRPITQGIMVDRNTMIATPDTLFMGDTAACLYINAATGALIDQFVPQVSGGTFWKWMGRENGIIYAVIGAREQMDADKETPSGGGWGWQQLSPGFNQSAHPWGFGKTVIAFNPGTKQVLWTHTESTAMDCRAVCMKNGRLFIFRWGSYLACLNTANGAEVWRRTPQDASDIFGAMGSYSESYGEGAGGWRTVPYLKCNNNAVYIANTRNDGSIVAVNAANGGKLWSGIEGRSRLIVAEQEVYAVSSYINRINALTGNVVNRNSGDPRAGCTAVTGCAGGIFTRGVIGTTWLNPKTWSFQSFFPFRPDCITGTTISNGHLYWWPWGCNCGYSIFSTISVSHENGFVHEQAAVQSERLERSAGDLSNIAAFNESANDWPTFRKDNTCSAVSGSTIPQTANAMWKFAPRVNTTKTTAPTAVNGVAFFGTSDGVVYAYDIAKGQVKWKAYTGGVIRFPPAISQGRVYVGSGDGFAYCFEAATGRQLWRFRGAPADRKIQVFGSLLSTWPAAAGALVQDGKVFFANGITPYDGTHIYALNAVDGSIAWQNNTSGRKVPGDPGGVAVQGQMLIYNNVLYLAGGNEYSPAAFDITNGSWLTSQTGSGALSEALYLYNGEVHGTGNRFYRDMDAATQSGRLTFHVSNSSKEVFWVVEPTGGEAVKVYNKGTVSPLPEWRTLPSQSPLWQVTGGYGIIKGVVLTQNAVIVMRRSPHQLTAYNVDSGTPLWTKALPGEALQWGLAVDKDGNVLVTLQNGDVLCYGSGEVHVESQPDQEKQMLVSFSLKGGSPNPFKAVTRINFSIARKTRVNISIIDIKGQLIKTLVDQDKQSGRYTAFWDGTDNYGKPVGSNVYQCMLVTKDFRKNTTLLLIK